MAQGYNKRVFINCPFDNEYNGILWAIVFTVHDCGFEAVSAQQKGNSTAIRIKRISDLIESSKFGIHDLSRNDYDENNKLPRFNMPLELGMFLGAAWIGPKKQQQKIGLILDRTQRRYQKYCSDLAGQDIEAHNGKPYKVVRPVRDWLNSNDKKTLMPGADIMLKRYKSFLRTLPAECTRLKYSIKNLPYDDYTTVVTNWQQANPW